MGDVGEPRPRTLERGDFGSLDWADPGIEFVIADGPEPGSWTGGAAMADAHRDFLSAWQDYRYATEEYRELDDERVLVFTTSSGRGKSSGLEVSQTYVRGANLFHVRDGKVTRLVLYWNRDRALADLGLEE
jgi:ketosteroid isomerase-like protein